MISVLITQSGGPDGRVRNHPACEVSVLFSRFLTPNQTTLPTLPDWVVSEINDCDLFYVNIVCPDIVRHDDINTSGFTTVSSWNDYIKYV